MKTFLFLGDSITDSHRLWLDDPLTLGDGYVHFIYQYCLQNLKYPFTILNKGHDGFTIRDLERCLDRDCLSLAPDVVSILIGVNDIAAEIYGEFYTLPDQYIRVYQSILRRIRSKFPCSKIILMEPFVFSTPEEYLCFHPYIRQLQPLLQELAHDFDAGFLTLHEAMNTKNALSQNLTTDGIHLTSRGSRLLADRWISLAVTNHIL